MTASHDNLRSLHVGSAPAKRWAISGRVLSMATGAADQAVVVVDSGTIVEVGGDRLRNQLSTAGDVELIDVGDRVVMPGFVDPHAHVQAASRALAEMVDVRVPRCRTVADVLQVLSDNVDRARDGWLVAQGNLFLDQKLEDRRLPTRAELDSVSGKLAIVIRAGGHTSVLNTRAFEASDVIRYAGRAGMMGGAVIWRDEAGEPTGVVSEVDAALPIPEPSPDELRAELRSGVRELFTRFGVTSIGEISETIDGLALLDEAVRTREIFARISVFLWAPGTMSFEDACHWERFLSLDSDPDLMKIRGVKLFADGGYSARNAAARTAYRAPYALHPGSRGKVNLNRRQIANAVRKTNASGLQLAVHANGERAQDVVCLGIEMARPSRDPQLQTRIEHAGNLVTDDRTTENWRRANILPVPQPVFLFNFGDFFPRYLGPTAAAGRFPFRRLLDEGWKLSGSSDVLLGAEERQTNPLFSVWCCLKRETFLGDILTPSQATTTEEALQMHTINAAHALGEDTRRGSLEAGKVADICVLARDPRAVEVDDIPTIAVDAVFTDGVTAHVRS